MASSDLPDAAVKQLRKIAPVLEIKSADASDQIGQMFTNLDLIAKATGTTDKAKTARTDFEAKVTEGKKALADAKLDGPLADPGVLGVSGGAALGAVLLVTTVPAAGSWGIAGAAFGGAALTSAIVFGLAARGGYRQNRLVLVGIGMAAGSTALISLLIVLTDPSNAIRH